MFIDKFSDAQQHLAGRHTVRPIDLGCFELDDVGPHELTVRVELLDSRGSSWLALAAAVSPETDSDAAACLRHNARLLVGGLAVDTDILWMRAVLPLATTSEAVDEALAYVVEQAHALVPAGRATDPSAFAHHGD